jgi:hypothetical protein
MEKLQPPVNTHLQKTVGPLKLGQFRGKFALCPNVGRTAACFKGWPFGANFGITQRTRAPPGNLAFPAGWPDIVDAQPAIASRFQP